MTIADCNAVCGAVFYKIGDRVDANRIIAELRSDGKLSKANPRQLSGFGSGEVGVAVLSPTSGYWAVVDSADGCQGIGGGSWSRPAVTANHLLTEAIWYRVFAEQLCLAVVFDRGGQWLRVLPGDRATVCGWLKERGVPIDESRRPADAKEGAVLFAIRYEEQDYRNGPDAEVAASLAAIRGAIVEGRAGLLRKRCAEMPSELLPLALGVVRATEQGQWQQCLLQSARTILAERMQPRLSFKEMIFEEEVLRRVARLVAGSDDALFVECLERLDAIEADAERQSSWAQTGGVALLAWQLHTASLHSGAFECYRRLVWRSNAPHWHHVNSALVTLLRSTDGPIVVKDDVQDLLRRCEARLGDLGDSAQDAINYNLACVHSRAWDDEAALAHLRRCRTIREQNPHPERDTDLKLLWSHPELATLLAPPEPSGPVAVEELEVSADEVQRKRAYFLPPERAVFRRTFTLEACDGAALISRMGGLPNVPEPDIPWPETEQRPMQFILQLVGVAEGTAIEDDNMIVIGVFADLDGDYFDARWHRVVMHRGPCNAVLAPPAGIEPKPAKKMIFTDGADDRLLVEIEDPYDEEALAAVGADTEAMDRAHSNAWCDKLWGIPVGANLDPDQRDSQGNPMRCLLQLVTFDDWFLWYLFVNDDFSEARMQIVRG